MYFYLIIFNLSKTVFPNIVKRFNRLVFFRLGGILTLAGVGRLDGDEFTTAIWFSRFSRCFTIFFFIFLIFFSSRMILFPTFFVWDLTSLSLLIKDSDWITWYFIYFKFYLELGLNIGVQLLYWALDGLNGTTVVTDIKIVQ